MKYLWLALFALFVGIASYFAEELFFPIRPSFSLESPEGIIYQDLRDLDSKKSLPLELQHVKEVFFSYHRLQKTNINWLEISKFYFPQKSTGKFDLQIEAFDTQDDEKSGKGHLSIFQFSLFDTASKNKIWEMSRTYKFSAKQKN